jgi:hypothetical protein
MRRLLIPLAVAALALPATAMSASIVGPCDQTPSACVATIQVASVNLRDGSLTSTSGSTFVVTASTRFHPTLFSTISGCTGIPAGCFPVWTAWNVLAARQAAKQGNPTAFLGILNTVSTLKCATADDLSKCQDKIVELEVSATSDGSQLRLVDVTPVLPPS